jgi:hypothetical protein
VERAKAAARTDEDRVMVHLWEGVLAADLSKTDRATAAFRQALALDRNAELPTQVSPKVRKLFEELRAQVPPPASDEPRKVALAPAASPAPATPTLSAATPSQRSLVVPLAFGGAAVAATAGATFFGLESIKHSEAARSAPFQGEANASLSQAQQSALVANILFATAGTALAGGVVTYLLGGQAAPTASRPQP